MTKHGFYSIVEKEEGKFHVRSRFKNDLLNLVKLAYLDAEVLDSYPNSDYQFRLIINKWEMNRVFGFLSQSIDYDNFKNCIGKIEDQKDKINLYHDIWGVIYDFGEKNGRLTEQ